MCVKKPHINKEYYKFTNNYNSSLILVTCLYIVTCVKLYKINSIKILPQIK